MLDEGVELLERAGIEQHRQAFARGELALAMLRLDAPLAAAEERSGAARLELDQDVLHLPLALLRRASLDDDSRRRPRPRPAAGNALPDRRRHGAVALGGM